MSKPKFSINERVMVRCHASDEATGDALRIDDCVIIFFKSVPAGEQVKTLNGSKTTQTADRIYYVVDQKPDEWIDEPFIFPYQQPGSSFKEQMQELDRPIKQLETA